ncbi:MAG: DUF177 domain-containing protein [Desulfobacterota bacterium]|nr:DUF177 domain-containing protein [Thermodesulfobacteriota bacterium]
MLDGLKMLTLKLEDIPEEGLELKWQEDPLELAGYLDQLSEIDFSFEGPLKSEVSIKKVGRSVLIRGEVEAVVLLRCGRCLKEFPHPIATSYDLHLHPLKGATFKEEMDLSHDELDMGFYEGGEIQLSEIACEQIFLEIPIQPLCQEGCRGLCSQCGTDLNVSTCQCVHKGLDSAFQVLKAFKLP